MSSYPTLDSLDSPPSTSSPPPPPPAPHSTKDHPLTQLTAIPYPLSETEGIPHAYPGRRDGWGASLWAEEDGVGGTLRMLGKRTDVRPNQFQTYTIIAAVIFIFAIAFLWHLPLLRDAISGFKLFVVGTHELFHILVGLLVGGEIISICIDPNLGGETVIDRLLRETPRMPHNPYEAFHRTLPQTFWSYKALATLSAGYIGSSTVGFLLTFAAFDIVASKVASFVIAIGLLVPALRIDSFVAFLSILASEGLLIGLWFGDHGNALRFYVLFVGQMHLFYVLWDWSDERMFDKCNSSDVSQFSNLMGFSPAAWASLWISFSCLTFVAAVIAGIAVFKKTPEEMYSDAASFLPT